MLTAKSAQEDRLEGFTAGADAYITKPFTSKELLLRTQMLIERRKTLQQGYQSIESVNGNIAHRNERESKFVKTILDTVQARLSDVELDISTLADATNMSERQFRRKFKAVFGQSPNQFIRTFRLKKAHELLRSHVGNVSEVCYQVGFNNVSYFSKCFREEIGISPSEVH
jgi:transcriptional regulator GlxA family with amidase domain